MNKKQSRFNPQQIDDTYVVSVEFRVRVSRQVPFNKIVNRVREFGSYSFRDALTPIRVDSNLIQSERAPVLKIVGEK